MKRILLMSVPALFLTGTVMAQRSYNAPAIKDKSVANRVAKASKYSAETGLSAGAAAAGTPNGTRSTSLTLMGTTTYQLQTNYSVQNRMVYNADGTLNAAWTFSATSGWADRGTGYVYNNGTSFSTAPTTRIEPVRTGWPSIMVLGDNSEVVIAHTGTAATSLNMAKRAVKGTGTWNSSTAISSPAPEGSVWPRACAGGSDGNTIHMIVVSNPTDAATNPVYWNGQQGCLTYSRSQDGGTTWDKLHTVPAAHDSTQYRGFGGDTYSIDAKGNVVAYVVGGPLNDLFLMKSTDNGNTWTKTVIMAFPIPFFEDQLSDINSDGVADTIDTNDGTVSLLIDDNDDVHVMFGAMRILNDDTTDGLYSYFPGTSGILYWNDNTGGTPQLIAGLEDTDGDGFITVSDWGTYQNSLTSFTSMGIDNSGKIHAAFAGLVENTDPLGGGKSVRNVYYFSSSDHGATWTTPSRIDPNEIQEQVWPSVARNAQADCIRMIYHGDEAPGHGTTSTNADYADNLGISGEAYYACVNPLVGITETVNIADMISLFPNPANTELTVTAIDKITKLELFNSMGELVGSYSPNTTRTSINVSALKPGLYIVNVYNGSQKISKTMMKD